MPEDASDRLGPDRVSQLVRELALRPGAERPCAYLPGRQAREVAFRASQMPSGLYRSLMDLNFRRDGDIFYQPACATCDACRAIRVPVAHFRPNRSQRRCWKANRDLTITAGPPEPTREKHRLFEAYLSSRHPDLMSSSWDALSSLMTESPLPTLEITYRAGQRLAGVAILDIEPAAASTVYCFFDPERPRRSLGTFNVLWSIEFAYQQGLEYLYLGYYVRDSRKMNYKRHFRPCEILAPDGKWQCLQR